MKRIGLLWHSFVTGNLGVSALTDANMSIIADAAGGVGKVRFVLFGPHGDAAFMGPDSLGDFEYVEVSSVKRLFHVRAELKTCDYVFDIGSGDSFSDIYGVKRFLKVAGVKFLVPEPHQRLVYSPQTMGPFKSFWAQVISRGALRRARMAYVRDDMSYERVVELIGTTGSSKLDVTTDVAFALQKLDSWPASFPVLEESKRHIAINVSGLLYAGGYTKDNQFGLSLNYPKLIENILERLTALDNTTVWLVPHVYKISTYERESDRAVSEDLCKRYPDVRMAPLFSNAREAKTFIASMDLVLAARMHAAIAAVSCGIACIPMSYSVKFQGLFSSLDYFYTVDLKTETLDEAEAKVMAALEVQGEMAASARKAAIHASCKLNIYRHFVARLLANDNINIE